MTIQDDKQKGFKIQSVPDIGTVDVVVSTNFDKPNANGVIYSKATMTKAVEEFNKKAPVIGELGYPSSGQSNQINLDRASYVINNLRIDDDKIIAEMQLLSAIGQSNQINLDKASHVIHNLRIDGDKIIAKMQLLSTPKGNIVKELINTGTSVGGMGMRGYGRVSLDESGNKVVKDFTLITFDVVGYPLPGCEFPEDFEV